MTREVPLGNGESAYITPQTGRRCAVHDMPAEGLAVFIVEQARLRHPAGIDVCRPCVVRARDAGLDS